MSHFDHKQLHINEILAFQSVDLGNTMWITYQCILPVHQAIIIATSCPQHTAVLIIASQL